MAEKKMPPFLFFLFSLLFSFLFSGGKERARRGGTPRHGGPPAWLARNVNSGERKLEKAETENLSGGPVAEKKIPPFFLFFFRPCAYLSHWQRMFLTHKRFIFKFRKCSCKSWVSSGRPWCLANAANAFAKKDGDQGGPIVPKVRNGLSRTGAGIGNESETTRENQ